MAENLVRWLAVCVVSVCLASPLWAATPSEQLEQSQRLFEQGKYGEAKDLLLKIAPSALTDEQTQKRNEMVEEVRVAINQSNKAQQDLADADKAFSTSDRVTAAKLYRGILNNNYASAAQKKRAREGLAWIDRQRMLANKMNAAPAGPQLAGAQGDSTSQRAHLQRDRVAAAAVVEAGDAALGRGQFDLAEQKYRQALKLVPNYAPALKGLGLVRQHRHVEGQAPLMDETAKLRLIRWKRTEVMLKNNERQIGEMVSKRQYKVARQKLALSRQLLEAARADAQPAERYNFLSRQLEALSRFIDSEEKEYKETQVAAQRRTVRALERERREADRQDRDERISQLFDQVMQLRTEKEYLKAADVLREILTIDPTYERAQFMLQVLEDAGLIQEQKIYRRRYFDMMGEALAEAESAKDPDVTGRNRKIVAYPDESEWRVIAERDPFGAGVSGEDERDRQVREKLEKIVPLVEFDEMATFEEVIDALRQEGDVSITVNWSALEFMAIDRDTECRGISLENVKIETAIRFLLDNVSGGMEEGLDFEVVDGVVRVSTIEDLNRNSFTRVYDVRDLLVKIPSFRSGGGMMGGMGGGMGGMRGGGGGRGGGDDDDESEEEREELIEDLEELIKNQIEPGTWEPEGTLGSVQIWNDRMIIRHTARAHRQMDDLLRQLRESKDLQVGVEAKFITLRSNFLEQIGVDLDVVLNNGNAGLDNALVLGQDGVPVPTVDPTTGALLVHPRRFTQLGFTPSVVPNAGVTFPQQTLEQPFSNVAMVPSGAPTNWWGRHTTSIPLQGNTLGLASPLNTGVPGSLASQVAATPAFQMFGSFLDNIQVDFLLRATQMDTHSSIVDAPRLVTFNGRGGYIQVQTQTAYVAQPGFLPAGGSGVGGQAATGRDPTIGSLPSGRTLDVTPTVSADRKYVTLTVRPMITNTRLSVFQGATGPLQLPELDITQIRTSVSVPDGGWVLLGGLKQAGETEVEAGVPILSKIPVLKRAFTNRSKVKDEYIVLILLRPTIIIQDEQEQHAYPDLISADNFGG